MSGAKGRNRTDDTRIFSPLLYHLSYRGNESLLTTLLLVPNEGLEPSTTCVAPEPKSGASTNFASRAG